MLTSEHAIVEYRRGRALPDRLSRNRHAHYTGYAKAMIAVYRNGVGRTRRELHRSVERLFDGEAECDPRRIHSFCKLLDDRCKFDTDRKGQCQKLRMEIFRKAAGRHPLVRERINLHEFEEHAVKMEIAAERGRPWEEIEHDLYCDVFSEHKLLQFDPFPEPADLLSRYNVAQVQACLYRAISMTVDARADFKTILRYAKLAGLLHEVHRRRTSHYRITFTGPASVLRQTRRYGVAMARFLPALLSCRDWKMSAAIRTPFNATLRLELSSEDGLSGHLPSPDEFDSSVEQKFAEKFGDCREGWTMSRETEIVHHLQKAFIPDFVFVHEDGTQVLMEIVGFWTPEYLQAKFDTLARFADRNILIAVQENSADTFQAISDNIVRYKTALKIGSIIQALENMRSDRNR